MTRPSADDKQQIGLTPTGQEALSRLMGAGLFDAEVDAYRCAIAYAIGKGLRPQDATSSGYATKYNARGTLDVDGLIRDLIGTLAIGEASRPYATAERLAEVGVIDLERRLATHERLGDILLELNRDSSTVDRK